ncbi:hypothetical protein AcW1_005558 [Taiwanofungus camphoratus]|nr:hypothetical protein AcW2_004327 [Antrodia cinnamomea]KAI0933846.1 hypothetical protein AcV5_005882 [Antrodia cinnamomea]KAI0948364.1 hypothetical protein AcV7_009130 [Antrodia cinnamomea]KAI0957039.1 hypothetical protein AcW1_005558 [Antrodia cinnamomea]
MSKQTKILLGAWGFLDICLLVDAIVAIVFSIIWREPNLLLNLELSTAHLNAGLILGVILMLSWIVSIAAIIQRNSSIKGFVVLNWALAVDAIAVLIVGTIIWFYTLQERNNYFAVWNAQSPETRLAIQNMFQCCGYFTPNDTVEFGGFCANATFVNSLVNPNSTDMFRCVSPITKHADVTLNKIFTSVYGFMAVVICLFLASLCVIKTRKEAERFAKIDVKRGGGGFV